MHQRIDNFCGVKCVNVGRSYTIKRMYLGSICRAKRAYVGSICVVKRHERGTLQDVLRTKTGTLKTCLWNCCNVKRHKSHNVWGMFEAYLRRKSRRKRHITGPVYDVKRSGTYPCMPRRQQCDSVVSAVIVARVMTATTF